MFPFDYNQWASRALVNNCSPPRSLRIRMCDAQVKTKSLISGDRYVLLMHELGPFYNRASGGWRGTFRVDVHRVASYCCFFFFGLFSLVFGRSACFTFWSSTPCFVSGTFTFEQLSYQNFQRRSMFLEFFFPLREESRSGSSVNYYYCWQTKRAYVVRLTLTTLLQKGLGIPSSHGQIIFWRCWIQ